MATPYTIRRLTAADAELYRIIRQEALEADPDAFTATAEAHGRQPLSEHLDRLAANAVFAAFLDGTPVGMVGLRINQSPKESHRGTLWGMYVSSRHRGTGLAQALLDALIAHARTVVEQVRLGVVASNDPARRFYERAGFQVYGRAPRAFKIAGRYEDELLMVKLLDG